MGKILISIVTKVEYYPKQMLNPISNKIIIPITMRNPAFFVLGLNKEIMPIKNTIGKQKSKKINNKSIFNAYYPI